MENKKGGLFFTLKPQKNRLNPWPVLMGLVV